MRILDLFCKAGGASMGLHHAGHEVVGVDIEPQPRYPFKFIQADALVFDLAGYDAYWASPPCQAYSDLRHRSKRLYPHLIEPIRARLRATGKPYIIENVDKAPLLEPQMLCGTMFGLRVFRHRIFETSFVWKAPDHAAHIHRTGSHRWPYKSSGGMVQVTGGGNCTVAEARQAMRIDWMTKAELNEAIPPAYAEVIGRQIPLRKDEL